MSEAELKAIEDRAAAADPGPWVRGEEHESMCKVEGPGGRRLFSIRDGLLFSDNDHNREFVVRARADVPALVAEVRRLREMLNRRGIAWSEADR